MVKAIGTDGRMYWLRVSEDGRLKTDTAVDVDVDTSDLEDIIAKDSTLQTLIDSLNFENGRLKTDTVANVDTSVLEDIVAKDETLNTFKNLFNFDENNRLKTDTSTVETELGEIKTKLDELETRLQGQKLAESQMSSDGGDETLTFADDIKFVEIWISPDNDPQEFTVGGVSVYVAPGGWRSEVDGTDADVVVPVIEGEAIVNRLK